MRHMLLAKRYARALFELAAESESLMRIGDDLALLDEMDYSVTLTVPPHHMIDAVRTALGEEVSPLFLNFISLLIRKGRFQILPDIQTEFNKIRDHHLGRRQVRVTTAVPLTETQKEKILGTLSSSHKGEIYLQENVDPRILGGLILQIDGRLYDGSVSRHLQRLRARLSAVSID